MDKSQKTIIGKDVIESLTLGMYEDSRFIFREYIQNSADQIDKSVNLGFLPSRDAGEIWIHIDKDERKISIEDNATGIKADEVVKILRNIAQSHKKRGVDKGFRGIGRLGGLGYCDRLTFETSYHGENVKSTMIWDAKELKNIINNRSKKEEAAEVIDKVTEFVTEEETADKKYFKVTLENVTNDILLDKHAIREYLQMVAPVPFHPRFIFKTMIAEELEKNNLSIDEYKIYVNTDQIFKAYTTSIYAGDERYKKKFDEIYEIRFFKFDKEPGEVLAWGWYGISNFEKEIPKRGNLARGLRLRSGNIQIGSEYCLVKLHKEPRGNFYFFGEVHAFHGDLIPNARRDYFLENDTTKLFEKELRKFFKDELYKLYYFASKVRGQQKRITQLIDFKKEYEKKSQHGFTNKEEIKKYEEKFEKLKEAAEEAKKELKKIVIDLKDSDTPKKGVLERLTNGQPSEVDTIELPNNQGNEKPKFLTDELTKLSKRDRKLLSRVFAVIDRVLPKELAENLKLKIKEEFE
ncbi:MAG: ATP-binding protein [Candidatus Pacebacteria bacterium]|nr:ATP-binding protein [Candidatus Paceibacterota bacterium]